MHFASKSRESGYTINVNMKVVLLYSCKPYSYICTYVAIHDIKSK